MVNNTSFFIYKVFIIIVVRKMNEDNELLLHIYQNSEMGVKSTTKLIEILKDKDNKIKKELECELKNYEALLKKSEKLLKKYKVHAKSAKGIPNFIINMSMQMEIGKDNSDTKVASLLTEGFNMGILDMKKRIEQYEDEVEKDILSLAKKSLSFQDKSIKNLEAYI